MASNNEILSDAENGQWSDNEDSASAVEESSVKHDKKPTTISIRPPKPKVDLPPHW
eukprot:CAMPEP_0194386992 /NCGR_PEP_ID=MMETSP0174-20130528/89445_1 /TAXON_ID=216777 /ORGANISM="Proboscia alata, Strain PI-D3" /LENGTH=55 /DNA_ID=CAMNT_0039176685 /DNA_START=431 /DNA_END=595 /DNA_ORIENTATION=-